MKYSPAFFHSSDFADPRARRDDEHRQVIAADDVVAQAQAVLPPLPSEVESMDRTLPARREQVDRVAVALRFEELPDRFHLHELRGLLFDLFHALEKRQRLLVVSARSFSKLPLYPEVPPVEHVRIDVAPDLGELRHVAHLRSRYGAAGTGTSIRTLALRFDVIAGSSSTATGACCAASVYVLAFSVAARSLGSLN